MHQKPGDNHEHRGDGDNKGNTAKDSRIPEGKESLVIDAYSLGVIQKQGDAEGNLPYRVGADKGGKIHFGDKVAVEYAEKHAHSGDNDKGKHRIDAVIDQQGADYAGQGHNAADGKVDTSGNDDCRHHYRWNGRVGALPEHIEYIAVCRELWHKQARDKDGQHSPRRSRVFSQRCLIHIHPPYQRGDPPCRNP